MSDFIYNEDIKIFSIFENSIIKDAIESLNYSSKKIVIVTDSSNNFIGTITDGDIRRAIIKGFKIDDKIKKIINSNSIFVVEKEYSNKDLQSIVRNYGIHQIPLINKKNKLIGLYEFGVAKNINKTDISFFIMAGGRGKRLMPLTNETPKPLLLVRGKPILEHIILNAKNQGFKNFYISTHHLSHKIKDYFGDGKRYNITINYVDEQQPLGTIGSIKLIKENLTDPFLVTNGDLITDVEYKSMLDFHEVETADATMAVRPVTVENKFGVVQLDGLEITGFEEKPINKLNINAGIYAFRKSVINLINDNEKIDTPDLFERLRDDKFKTIAYPIYEGWQDIGNHEDYEQIKNNLKE